MFMGLHPRLERDLVQAIDERPVAFPLAMLAVSAVFVLVLLLVLYAIGALSAPGPTEMVRHTADADAASGCIRRVSYQYDIDPRHSLMTGDSRCRLTIRVKR